jgi:hypothetical protein
MRVCILASGAYVIVQLWASGQHFLVRSAMQGNPRTFGLICGMTLLFSSIVCCFRDWRLGCSGLLLSLITLGLALPMMAYN